MDAREEAFDDGAGQQRQVGNPGQFRGIYEM
jgi:hypothetical protein